METAEFSKLENQLARTLGAQAPENAAFSHYEYYEDFVQSGTNKAKYIIDKLHDLEADPELGLHLDRCAYLSVGGADGAEIMHVMDNTPIRYGILQDFSSELLDKMRERQQALQAKGKTLLLQIGDVTQRIPFCRNQLLQWQSQGLIEGLVCSAQAVLHELPSRSPGFDIDAMLGDIFWKWNPCLFFCREPCKPEGWPDRVKLSIGSPAISSELLEPFANQVKLYVGMQGEVKRAGPTHIILPATLAIEMFTKFIYLRDYKHELGEQATFWGATELTRRVQAGLEAYAVECSGDTSVTHETMITDSFEKRYNRFKINAFDPATNAKLQIPRVFVRILGKRWIKKRDVERIAATPAQETVELAVGTLTGARFAELLKNPESKKLDFKSKPYRLDNDALKSKFIKDVVSIANTNPANEPGYIIIGVGEGNGGNSSPRSLLGVSEHPDDADLQGLIRDKIAPPPNFLYYTIEYENKTFGVVEIRPTASIHECRRDFGELKEGQTYTRAGSRNSVAYIADITALMRARFEIFNRANPPQTYPVTKHGATQLSETDVSTDLHSASSTPLPASEPADQLQTASIAAKQQDVILASEDQLVVTFVGHPSRAWKDPSADILGLWSPSGKPGMNSFIPLAGPLRIQGHGGDEIVSINETKPGFCIPGLDVELEFRERSLVQGPIWSRIKERVVRQFLDERKGKRSIARIIGPRSSAGGPYLLLSADDYNVWLNARWAFYRGIESALTITELYRRQSIATMIEDDLRKFVENELIATGKLADSMPERYKKASKDQPIDADSVMLVLEGMIQQELKFHRGGSLR